MLPCEILSPSLIILRACPFGGYSSKISYDENFRHYVIVCSLKFLKLCVLLKDFTKSINVEFFLASRNLENLEFRNLLHFVNLPQGIGF